MTKKKSEPKAEYTMDLVRTMEGQQAAIEWAQRVKAEQKKAEVERMVEAKVAQALRRML